jgi:soluble lytic murein transglycosylase
MRPGQYEQAERYFVAALEALGTQSPRDARIRATLGNLVRLAAIYQRLEREPDARRVMTVVGDHVDAQGQLHLRGDPYDSRYRDLVGQPLALAFGGRSRAGGGSGSSKRQLDALIARTARNYRVDPALVKAVVAAESNFEPRAVSHAGAQGLMQLMPETAEEMGVRSPFKPSDNLRGGVRYLRQMIDRYGDLSEALAAYNAGPTAVDRYGGIPPYPETREYVKRVMNFYRGYQDQFTR